MFSNLFSKIIKTDNEVKLSYNLPDEICEISENRTEDNMYYLENFLIRNGYKKKEIKYILENDNPFDYLWKTYSMPNTQVDSYMMFLLNECDRKAKQIKLLIIEGITDYHITTECFWYLMFYLQSRVRYNMQNNSLDMREFEYFIKTLAFNDKDLALSYFDKDVFNAIALYSKKNNKTIVELFENMFKNLELNKQYFSNFVKKIGGEEYLKVMIGKLLQMSYENNDYSTKTILIKAPSI